MAEISLCMIVKNEEDVIGRLLENVSDLFDEIIICDTGSTDKTCEIASKFTDKIYHFEWCDDFSKARNYAFSKGTKEYLMWLDADDIIKEKDEFLDFKNNLSSNVDIVYMPYHTGFDEDGNTTFKFYRERIVKRDKGYMWVEPVHEVIDCSGKSIFCEVGVYHDKLKHGSSTRNLDILAKNKETLSTRLKYYYARELKDNGKTQDAILAYEDFLSENGYFEDCITACYDLAECYSKFGDYKSAVNSALKGLSYNGLNAKLCCKLGDIYFEQFNYERAKEWYIAATNLKPPKQCFGFFQAEFYDFYPFLQLCVAEDRLGNFEEANAYNEKAGALKPNHPAVKSNREYFKTKL